MSIHRQIIIALVTVAATLGMMCAVGGIALHAYRASAKAPRAASSDGSFGAAIGETLYKFLLPLPMRQK